MCAQMCLCTCTCVWRPEVEVESLSHSLSTLFIEAEFQLNPESYYTASLSSHLAPGPCLLLQNAGISLATMATWH